MIRKNYNKDMTIAYVDQLPLCDFCNREHPVSHSQAKYDARTVYDSWAYMCDEHFEYCSDQTLGPGFGQKLIVK